MKKLYQNILLALWLVPLMVWAEYFEISDYTIRVRLTPEGKFAAEETITVLFYQPRRGIYRNIPTRWQGDSISHRFQFNNIQVKNFPYKVSRENNLLTIRIGSPSSFVEGTQTYIISYEISNPILVFTNKQNHQAWQALYWNLIGTDWDVPIRKASFEIRIEKPWQPSFTFFAGRQGSTETNRIVASYDSTSQTIFGRLVGELAPNEAVTILCSFPDGFWDISQQQSFWDKYGFMITLIASILYVLGLFILWARFGKDKPFVKMVSFYPPADLSPAEAGMLFDNKVDARDVIAIIFQWAAQGNIIIEEKPAPLGKDFIFHKQKPLTNPTDYERVLWKGLFSQQIRNLSPYYQTLTLTQPSSTTDEEKESVKLSSLKDQFATAFEITKALIKDSVADKSLYKPYSRELGGFMLVLSVLLLFGGVALAAVSEIWYLAIVSPILALITFFFSLIMPARTEIGQKYYEDLVGFREFVKRAEWPQLERLLKNDPLYFDKTLPYAIIFGLEKKWIARFSPILQTPPSWYTGTTHFTPLYLSSAIHSSINQMGTVLSSSPSSGGSGGGGFSGGGGGGGGGGSW